MKHRSFLVVLGVVSASALAAPHQPACRLDSLQAVRWALLQPALEARYCSPAHPEACQARLANLAQLQGYMVTDGKVDSVGLAAFMLATVVVETGIRQFSPAAVERGQGAGKDYGQPDPRTGQRYYGRGWVQLTYDHQYRMAGERLGLPLLTQPDLALQPHNSYRILVTALTEGIPEVYRQNANGASNGQGPRVKAGDFISATQADYAQARAVINANCVGRCTAHSRLYFEGKGYLPKPAFLDAADKTHKEALFFEKALCKAAAAG